MKPNGSNGWNVSFTYISWTERVLRTHSNVELLARHSDLVFAIRRHKQGDSFSIVTLNEYVMSLSAVQRVIDEFGKPGIIHIGGGWNKYTPQALQYCLSEQIGLYVSDELTGALWADEYWTNNRVDEKGNRVFAVH